MKLLLFSRIRYLFRDSTINSLSVSRNSPSIHYLFHQFTINSQSIPRIHYEYRSFTRINYLSGEFTVNSLGLSQIYQEFTFCFAMTLWIHYLIGPLLNNFSNLDIFTVDDIWNVHILVRRNVIRGVKTKNEVQNAFWIFWSSKIFSWSTLAG